MLELVERRRESAPPSRPALGRMSGRPAPPPLSGAGRPSDPSPLEGGAPSGTATTGRRSGMSTEARGLQGQPAAGRRDGALSRQVVVPLLLVLAAAAGCLDAMAVSRL